MHTDKQKFRITRAQAELDALNIFWYREGDVCVAVGGNWYDFKGCGNSGRRVDRQGLNFGDTDTGNCEDGVFGDGIWAVRPEHLAAVTAATPGAVSGYVYPTVSDYAYPTIADYEACSGLHVTEAFKIGWRMARTTNTMLGLQKEQA